MKSFVNALQKLISSPAHPPPPDSASPPLGDFSILQDDMLGWLRFVNAGMLDNGNIVALDHAIRHMPPGALVEIGSFCGLSANVITHLRQRHHRTDPFFTCDPWLFEGADSPDTPMGHGGISFGEYRELVKSSFIQNLRAFSRFDLPITVETTSDDFFERWQQSAPVTDVFDRPGHLGGPIACAYIDGDHRYDQARRDFEHIDRHLIPGGFILFDDSADGSGWDVCQLVQEIAANDNRFMLIGKYGNYLFQKRPV